MFWLRVLAIGQLALLVRRHLSLLAPEERGVLARLVGKSRGRPQRNLTAPERAELLRIVRKLEPADLGRGAYGAVRRPWRQR